MPLQSTEKHITSKLDQVFNLDTTYTSLPDIFFKVVQPSSVSNPSVLLVNEKLATKLDINLAGLSTEHLTNLFSGNQSHSDAANIAQAYAGHQFGHFNMLGDGRAILIGEHLTQQNCRVDIQFKGAGRTPYSRGGDGRAVLGPMLREYIISEAMAALGIPTTRSLAVVATGDLVQREQTEQGAVLTRIASSHLRVGTFQYAATFGSNDDIQALVQYAINRHYPDGSDSQNLGLALLQEVVNNQVSLICHWQRVGFIHGVMNTDNMAVSGETIDYGPCAFMDTYDPETVFSSIDRQGRYRFENQPIIAQWNIARLAEALLPIIHSDRETAIEQAKTVLESFETLYQNQWLAMMGEKIGIKNISEIDRPLIEELLSIMNAEQLDFTNTFWALGNTGKTLGKTFSPIMKNTHVQAWVEQWQLTLNNKSILQADAEVLMNQVNPAVIPRNHQVEQALNSATESDMEPTNTLLNVLATPYLNAPDLLASEYQPYQVPPQEHEKVTATFCGT